MRRISDTIHGVLDYVTAGMFLVAPSILEFSEGAAIVSYTIGAVHLLMSLVTTMPLGAVSIVPMRVHGQIELVVALGLIVLPYAISSLFGQAALFFTLMGVGLLVVHGLSRYEGQTRSITGTPLTD